MFMPTVFYYLLYQQCLCTVCVLKLMIWNKIFQNKTNLDEEYYCTGKTQGSDYKIFFVPSAMFEPGNVLNFFLAYFHRFHVRIRADVGEFTCLKTTNRLRFYRLLKQFFMIKTPRVAERLIAFVLKMSRTNGFRLLFWNLCRCRRWTEIDLRVLWPYPYGMLWLILYVSSTVDTGTI